MNLRKPWARDELIIAMNLYCKLPFGQLDHRTPIIIEVAGKLGRTSSSLAMKLSNFTSLDPVQQARGIRGLSGASKADRKIWEEFTMNWEQLGTESEERFQELVGVEFFALNQPSINQKSKLPGLPSIKYPSDQATEATETWATTKIRIGQRFFRDRKSTRLNSSHVD